MTKHCGTGNIAPHISRGIADGIQPLQTAHTLDIYINSTTEEHIFKRSELNHTLAQINIILLQIVGDRSIALRYKGIMQHIIQIFLGSFRTVHKHRTTAISQFFRKYFSPDIRSRITVFSAWFIHKRPQWFAIIVSQHTNPCRLSRTSEKFGTCLHSRNIQIHQSCPCAIGHSRTAACICRTAGCIKFIRRILTWIHPNSMPSTNNHRFCLEYNHFCLFLVRNINANSTDHTALIICQQLIHYSFIHNTCAIFQSFLGQNRFLIAAVIF